MPKLHNIPVSVGGTPKDHSNATVTALSLGASFVSDPIYVGMVDAGSMQVHLGTGNAVGTLKIQRSNYSGDWANSDPTTWDWTDWTGATATTTATSYSDGSAPYDFDLVKITCRWLRLKWTRTSGTNPATAVLNVKGPM